MRYLLFFILLTFDHSFAQTDFFGNSEIMCRDGLDGTKWYPYIFQTHYDFSWREDSTATIIPTPPEDYFLFKGNQLQIHYKNALKNYYYRYYYEEFDGEKEGYLQIYSGKKEFENNQYLLYYYVHFTAYGLFLSGNELDLTKWDDRSAYQIISLSKEIDSTKLMYTILGDWKCGKPLNLLKMSARDTIRFNKSDFSDTKEDSLWIYNFSRVFHSSGDYAYCSSRSFDFPTNDTMKIDPVNFAYSHGWYLEQSHRYMRPYLIDLSKRQLIFFVYTVNNFLVFDILKLTDTEMILKLHQD